MVRVYLVVNAIVYSEPIKLSDNVDTDWYPVRFNFEIRIAQVYLLFVAISDNSIFCINIFIQRTEKVFV